MKRNNLLKEAGIFLIVTALLTSTMLIATADYDEDQNVLFAQYPPDPSNHLTRWVSDTRGETESHIVIDDFWDVQHPIHEIGWWGVSWRYDDGWNGCEPYGMIFDILFYEDFNGEPDKIMCSYENVEAEITLTDIVYHFEPDIYFNLLYFEVTDLSPPCMLSEGWISIQGVDDDDCWFLWQRSPEGNQQSYLGVDFNSIYNDGIDFSFVLKTDAPEMKTLEGPTEGNIGEEQTYTIMAEGHEDYELEYYVDWRDGTIDDWFGLHTPGDEVTVTHTWEVEGDYTIKAKAKNSMGMETDYMTLQVTMPKYKQGRNSILEFLRNRFQILANDDEDQSQKNSDGEQYISQYGAAQSFRTKLNKLNKIAIKLKTDGAAGGTNYEYYVCELKEGLTTPPGDLIHRWLRYLGSRKLV